MNKMPNYIVLLVLFSASLLRNNGNAAPMEEKNTASGKEAGNDSIVSGSESGLLDNDTKISQGVDQLSTLDEKSFLEKIANLTSEQYDKIVIETKGQEKMDSNPSESDRDGTGRALFLNLAPVAVSSTSVADPNAKTTGPLARNINSFFDNFRSSFSRALEGGRNDGLRLIGRVDQDVAKQQEAAEKQSFDLVLQGQKTAAKLYDLTPKFVNTLIQRFGTSRDTGLYKRLNAMVTQFRDNSKKFYDAFQEHEHDFNRVFNGNVWPTINRYLGVQNLPQTPNLTWHSS